jgi:hypothetical protein
MSIIASGTTSGTALVSTGNTNGNLVFQTNGTTTALTLSTAQAATFAGVAQFPTTIGVGNATPAASGSGISFPATASASSDANTLDDYEEGTWTPAFTGTSTAGSGSYSFQAGSYTKVGRLVTIYGGMQFSSGTGTGNLQISGLPFSSNNFGSISIVSSDNLAFTAGSTLTGYSSGTNIQLQQIPSGGAGSTAAVPYDANIAQFIFFGSYFTS